MNEGSTIQVRSPRLGTYEVPLDRIVHLPDGLVGLPEARRFALLDPATAGSPFRYLLCVDRPELVFLVCEPESFWPGYAAKLPRTAGAGPQAAVLAIVTVPANARDMTANLMAPLVIDDQTRQGRQVVLESGGFSTRQPILAPAETPANPPR